MSETLYLVQLIYTDYSEGTEYALENQEIMVVGIFDSVEKAKDAVKSEIEYQVDNYDFDYKEEDIHLCCTIPDKMLSFYDDIGGLIKTFEYEILEEVLNFVQHYDE